MVDVADLPDKFRPVGNLVDTVQLPEVAIRGSEPDTVVHAPRLPNEGIDLKDAPEHPGAEPDSSRHWMSPEGVVAHAAKRLHMRRTTLVEKLRKYGLQRQTESTGI